VVFFASFALAKTKWARTREEVVDAKKARTDVQTVPYKNITVR
jgi:hypothetical protein